MREGEEEIGGMNGIDREKGKNGEKDAKNDEGAGGDLEVEK